MISDEGDFDELALSLIGHVLIRDAATGEVILSRRDAAAPEAHPGDVEDEG